MDFWESGKPQKLDLAKVERHLSAGFLSKVYKSNKSER